MSLAAVKLPPPGLPDNPVPEPAGMASLKARGYARRGARRRLLAEGHLDTARVMQQRIGLADRAGELKATRQP